jgi:hypothetical protein
MMYQIGLGMPRNHEMAVKWSSCAARQGDVQGQHVLGTLYLHGQGVPQDQEKAYLWFSLAAAQGDKQAREQLDRLELVIEPSARLRAQRLACEWRPEEVAIGFRCVSNALIFEEYWVGDM